MRWLCWRHKRNPARLQAAEQSKANADAQWPMIHRLAASLQAHRDENHFAEMFMHAMERRDGR